MVLVEETQTFSVLIGSCRGGAGTHLVLEKKRQTLSVLMGFGSGDAYPYCSWWLYSRGEASTVLTGPGKGVAVTYCSHRL